jgi:16S rRNA (cytosine1402-N4)-methyltransferase
VDATLGLGGHTEALLAACAPDGRVVAVDRDPEARALARARLATAADRLTVVEGNFDRFDERAGLVEGSVDGVLADLGVSSLQLDRAERGFSFRRPGPLDMRMDPTQGPTAAEMLRAASLEDLEGWLRRAGEERFAGKLARRLKDLAPGLGSTADLAEAVARCVPRRGKSHPATRVFLALRMAVNREMESLDEFLARAARVLKPGGRLAVLTFHSEEDRRVKEAGRGGPPWRAVTKKPRTASGVERAENPRSRSAKLRVLEKI